MKKTTMLFISTRYYRATTKETLANLVIWMERDICILENEQNNELIFVNVILYSNPRITIKWDSNLTCIGRINTVLKDFKPDVKAARKCEPLPKYGRQNNSMQSHYDSFAYNFKKNSYYRSGGSRICMWEGGSIINTKKEVCAHNIIQFTKDRSNIKRCLHFENTEEPIALMCG